jgi:hypothetical protein
MDERELSLHAVMAKLEAGVLNRLAVFQHE